MKIWYHRSAVGQVKSLRIVLGAISTLEKNALCMIITYSGMSLNKLLDM